MSLIPGGTTAKAGKGKIAKLGQTESSRFGRSSTLQVKGDKSVRDSVVGK